MANIVIVIINYHIGILVQIYMILMSVEKSGLLARESVDGVSINSNTEHAI